MRLINERTNIVKELYPIVSEKGFKLDVLMTSNEFESISEEDQVAYKTLAKALIFLQKVIKRDYRISDTFLTPNSFYDKVFQFEKLSKEDTDEIIGLSNSAYKEQMYGLNVYAKLMEFKKSEKIYGDSICDQLYIAFVEKS